MKGIAIVALAGLSLSACGGGSDTAQDRRPNPPPSASQTASPNTMELVGRSFSPSFLRVPHGTTVTWVNRSTATSCRDLSGGGVADCSHNVASADGLFDSHPTCRGIGTPCMATDEKFTYTFSTPGTYIYYCYIHATCAGGTCNGMSGRVVVT